MASAAQKNLDERLQDVDELIKAHRALTGGGKGRPAERQGAAVTRAGSVLLCATFEAFVEDVFDRAATDMFSELNTAAARKDFFRETSGRLNNANVKNVNFLYAQIGYPWVLNSISWRGFNNENLRSSIDDLVSKRNQIAHGKKPAIRLATLNRWKNMVEVFGPKFEAMIKLHAEAWTNGPLDWNANN